ncbi:MAG: zinc ribbon domain-containing protein [Desulfobulbaceae bacterium]|nr:zinc ribbon domain-containing protein [Desulfobulbaceae bacterium]
MPVYEYECKSCENIFEIQQKISDDPLASCPDCGSEVKKIVSRSSFHLKGQGWYNDGYSGSSNAAAKKSEKKDTGAAPACQTGGCKGCPASA